jgi:hypothetical protein
LSGFRYVFGLAIDQLQVSAKAKASVPARTSEVDTWMSTKVLAEMLSVEADAQFLTPAVIVHVATVLDHDVGFDMAALRTVKITEPVDKSTPVTTRRPKLQATGNSAGRVLKTDVVSSKPGLSKLPLVVGLA